MGQAAGRAHEEPGPWVAWNLLDLYAASDIPETEGTEISRSKWAASAGHVAGRRLIAAEAATWLGEHFRTTLADIRANVDRYFVAGVNHVVYHGTAASPAGAAWPGWLFYASVELNDRNPWWRDLPALNQYVTRVQSFLQSVRRITTCCCTTRSTTSSRRLAAGGWRTSAARMCPTEGRHSRPRATRCSAAASPTTSCPTASFEMFASKGER